MEMLHFDLLIPENGQRGMTLLYLIDAHFVEHTMLPNEMCSEVFQSAFEA